VQNPANPQTLNRYSYCVNNPLKYVDPSGCVNVYVNNEGLNDNGEIWYSVYSNEGYTNLIAIMTGGDNLATMYAHDSITLKNDPAAMTSQLNTPAFDLAKNIGLLC
jgi:hypothetical protein